MAQSPTIKEANVSKCETNIKVERQDEQHTPDFENPDDVPDQNAQDGVRIAEAMTLSWSKSSLIVVYIRQVILVSPREIARTFQGWNNILIDSMYMLFKTTPVPVISVVSSVMQGATYFPVAKILNFFELYAAANIFYSVGFTGMIFCIDVVTSDTSSLRNRGLAFAFTSSPYMITAFGGPAAADTIHDKNWRWGYGAWAIVLPFVAVPMVVMMQLGKRKAQKNGLVLRKPSGRTWSQSTWHYLIEFDIVDVVLLCAGLVLFLLSFTIASSSSQAWATDYIIAMLVVGFALLIIFGFWERFGARQPFVPWHLLKNRTVAGACLLDFTYQVAYYCCFTSYLQVVYYTSVASAGYISSIFDITSGIELLSWEPSSGTLVVSNGPGHSLGYIIMCQIFIALGGGVMILVQQIALVAASDHNDVAALLALLGLFGYIGGSVGGSISGAIWTNTLPGMLQSMLPESSADQWQEIYDSLPLQLSYPMGSETRTAIMYAYAATQKRMLIAGTAIMTLALFFMMMIKDINVKNIKQTKGTIF
ncbi:siderophore iron transporter mirB [Penicillium sp. IBT 16267x]|nr:siderophore iron transporter mirB [Penicillium sp. IBT 16267x]